MSASENIRIVEQANNAFNTVGPEGFADFLDEHVIDYFPFDRKPLKGKQAIIEDNEAFREIYNDLKIEIFNIFGEGDWVCFQAIVTGVHKGGNKVRVPICNVVKLKDGKITEVHEYFDQSTFAAQIQAVQ
ncbi:MAG: nuclear transport factor 2 family protein [Candidatus Thorarchaeota archaeon]